MSVADAQFIFFTALAIAGAIWMLDLWLALRIGECRTASWHDDRNFHGPGGEIQCDMPAERLFPRLKKLLRHQAITVSTIRFAVREENDNSLTFERLGPILCNLPSGVAFSSVKFEMAEKQGKQVLRYQLDQYAVMNALKRTALGICLFLTIPVITIIAACIWYFCVNSEQIAIRYQVYQMLQMIHVLWPPLLFVSIAGQMQRGVRYFIENVVEHAADELVQDEELNASFVTGGVPVRYKNTRSSSRREPQASPKRE